MKYEGRLYGKLGKVLFPLEHTTEDFNKMLEALKSVSSDLNKLGFVDFFTHIKIKSILNDIEK